MKLVMAEQGLSRNPYRYVQMISLESNFLPDLKGLLQEALPVLKEKLLTLNFRSEEETAHHVIREIFSLESKVAYKAKNLNFMNHGETLISIPMGFKGYFVDYGHTLNKALADALPVLNTVLQQATLQLSFYITNKDALMSVQQNHRKFEEANDFKEDLSKKLQHFIVENNGVSKDKIKNVLYRFGDVDDLNKIIHHMNQQLKTFNLNDIKSKTDEIIKLSDMIIQQIKADQNTKVSPMTGKTISQMLYFTAGYIEFMVALYYDMIVYLQALEALYQQLIKL